MSETMKTEEAPLAATGSATILEHAWAFGKSRALLTAVELGIFDHVASGHSTAAEIARAGKLDERGVRVLADALVALELLAKEKNGYTLTPASRVYLLEDSPAYLGPYLGYVEREAEGWRGLTAAVRAGGPPDADDLEARSREHAPELVAALFPANYSAANAARRALPKRIRRHVTRVLDVASGSGAWSLAWAVSDARVRVTAIDFAPIHVVARLFADRLGVTDRYEFVDGNIRDASFGRDRYDLVILGNICHSEGAKRSQKLIKKAAAALADGGVLLVADMIVNDARTGPVTSLMFAVDLLINTTAGDVFTLAEYREWAEAAGLTAVRRLDLGPSGPGVVIAEKRTLQEG
jgi:SAM-dependent methyltransferase